MASINKITLTFLVAIGLTCSGCGIQSTDSVKITPDIEMGMLNNTQIEISHKTAPSTQTTIPILMYHYVRDVDPASDPVGYNLSISPYEFERQLRYMRDNEFVGIHLSDISDGTVPNKAVVLTFDDGYDDFYDIAAPLLEQYGFTASNSIIVNNMVSEEENPSYFMNADKVRDLINRDFEITSHTMDHLQLSDISIDQTSYQLEQSKKYLEDTFDIKISALVYPVGKYNQQTMQIAKDIGYDIAVTTEFGVADLTNHNYLSLPRLRIDNRVSLETFADKLENSY